MGESILPVDRSLCPGGWIGYIGRLPGNTVIVVIQPSLSVVDDGQIVRLGRDINVDLAPVALFARTEPALFAEVILRASDAARVCICSNEVIFRPHFSDRLREVSEELERQYPSGFVLSGYSWFNPLDHGLERGRLATRFRPEWYAGMECLLFPRALYACVESRFLQLESSPRTVPGSAVAQFCEGKFPLLITNRSLVQRRSFEPIAENPNAHYSPTFDDAWPGHEEDVQFHARRCAAELAVNAAGGYPNSRYRGRGIVICGGGQKYFPCAFVAINVLRQLGCKLPIELWYLGPPEMTERMRSLVAPLGVTCVDALAMRQQYSVRILNGWELKCYAMLHSSFEEVLFLDADNVAVHDPEYLFECQGYQRTGAIFWPDIGRMPAYRDIWRITGVPFRDEPEFESGQILVNKRRCWTALQLAMHYNEHSDFYYRHVYGDKETFHFAWRKLEQEYSMPTRGIEFLDGTLCQHDLDGRRVFQHRVKKWALDGNSRTEGFLHERDCLVYLQELRHRWSTPPPVIAGDVWIPRVIHRIWLTPDRPIPDEYKAFERGWAKRHPGWEIKTWTLENLPPLIHAEIFSRLKNFGQMSDLLRYEVLHRFGGIYVDTDFECLRCFEPILGGVTCFIGEEDPERLGNAILGAIPGHPFISALLRGIPASFEANAGMWPVDQSGPGYVTRVAAGRNDVTIFPFTYFYPYSHRERHRKGESFPEAYAVHHWAHSWFGLENDRVFESAFVKRWSPFGKTLREKRASDLLTSKAYNYCRVGYDERPITFRADGTIGQGSARCEQFWDVRTIGKAVVLSIYSDTELTCALTRERGGIWRGKWTNCEKMPVVVSPI